MRAEKSAQPLIVNDWRHKLSDHIYGEYVTTGAYPFCVNSILVNGKAQIECLTQNQLEEASHELVGKPKDISPRGCTPTMMLRPGFNMSDLSTQTCSNTSSHIAVISADPEDGWVALHLANTGSVSDLSFSIDGHSMMVYAVDGLYVDLSEIQVLIGSIRTGNQLFTDWFQVLHPSIGARYSVLVRLNPKLGNYYIRTTTYPYGEMQQVLQSKAILSYKVCSRSCSFTSNALTSPTFFLYLLTQLLRDPIPRFVPH